MTPPLLDDYSIEITASDAGALAAATGVLPRGAAVSITFLPGSRLDRLIATAAHVRTLGFEPVPHIAARRVASRAELEYFLDGLTERAAITRAFVIGGDPPAPMGPFADALSILSSGLLQARGVRMVGVAGYPEGHAAIATAVIERALLEKVDAANTAGIDLEIVTQFAFDADNIAGWVAGVRALGVAVPIRVGIPGPASVQQLLRFAARCGVGASAKVMAKYGVSITRLLSTAAPDALIKQLSDRLVAMHETRVKTHLYPFGGVEKATRWAGEALARAQRQVIR